MAAYAEAMIYLHRIQVVPLTVIRVYGIAGIFMALRAFLEFFYIGDITNRVMTSYAGHARLRRMLKEGVGIYQCFVLFVIEENQSPPAIGVEPDGHPLICGLGRFVRIGEGR